MPHKYKNSYGLIVIVKNKQVVLIKRKFPYVFQQYLMDKKVKYTWKDFSEDYLNKQNESIKKDYARYENNEIFEDQYDFPHGQLDKKSKRYQTVSRFWANAFREFTEETGFHFDKCNIVGYKTVSFLGCDEKTYVQTYFIVHVDKVKKIKQPDDFFTPVLCTLDKARELLQSQQFIKKDDKHLLI